MFINHGILSLLGSNHSLLSTVHKVRALLMEPRLYLLSITEVAAGDDPLLFWEGLQPCKFGNLFAVSMVAHEELPKSYQTNEERVQKYFQKVDLHKKAAFWSSWSFSLRTWRPEPSASGLGVGVFVWQSSFRLAWKISKDIISIQFIWLTSMYRSWLC